MAIPEHLGDIKGLDPFNPGFENILNFRDVGKTINEFLGKKIVREGLLFRSARPDEATPEDQVLLKDGLGIKTIMDLRTKTEHINAAKRRHPDIQAQQHTTPPTSSGDAGRIPAQIPGVRYLGIGVTGRGFQLELIRQMSWWNIFVFFVLFLFGFRMKAIAILAREVMVPIGLTGLGLITVDKSKSAINEALTAIVEPGTLPVLVHCTQGKDRTGLIVMLTLMILGVPTSAVDFDYQLTNDALLPDQEERMAEIRGLGLSEDFGRTAPDLVQAVKEHLENVYGGLDGYLDTIGFHEEQRNKLRQILLY